MSPTQRELEHFSLTLFDLKQHLLDAEQQLSQPSNRGAVERAALALRKCLEGVVLSTLVVHQHLLTRGTRALAHMDAHDVRKTLRTLNPRYWPAPQDIARSDSDVVLTGVGSGYVTSEAYGRAIGTTSKWLHWRNPLAPPLDLVDGQRELRELFDQLERLLRVYTTSLPGTTDLLLCSLNLGRSGSRTPAAAAGVVNLTKQGELPR